MLSNCVIELCTQLRQGPFLKLYCYHCAPEFYLFSACYGGCHHMNSYTSPSTMKAAQARRKSPGWAAFGAKQHQNQGVDSKFGEDPYPPMPSALPSLHPHGNSSRNKVVSARSFSSMLVASRDFPVGNVAQSKLFQGGESGGGNVLKGESYETAVTKLKEAYGWSHSGLIEDVLSTMNYDIDKASTLLKEMTGTINNDERIKTRSTSEKFDESHLLVDTTDFAAEIADLSSILDDALKDDRKELRDPSASCGLQSLSDDTTDNMKRILKHLRCVPVEPEWSEDDVYLRHRKGALTTMRSASRHSRAATNAFLRGDHYSAQQHSLKAEELWLTAEELNSKAAMEILSVRNGASEPWKLDLHGLHAAEAVKALEEHMQKLETHVPVNRLASQDMTKSKNGSVSLSLVEPLEYNGNVDTLEKQQKALRQRPTTIEVITGVGKHSRGQASLPSAIRNFLLENRYRFDETRPGMITVWPKFRWN